MQILKRILLLSVLGLLTFLSTHQTQAREVWSIDDAYQVSEKTLGVYTKPNLNTPPVFDLYYGMPVKALESRVIEGRKWFKISHKSYWIIAIDQGGRVNLTLNPEPRQHRILDLYGILNQPHRYAVKLVKYSKSDGRMAAGRLETYKKRGNQYIFSKSYEVNYPKQGAKDIYGDLKTVGGPVVRYLYRTTRSGMNGYNKNREHFGVYKVSYPMPHDGIPHLLNGRMTPYQYNKLPALNYRESNGKRVYYPHPHSMLGADIVIHTARKGSLGCIILDNEEMSDIYHRDVVTENDTEIIPMIIYDEGVKAPVKGKLF